MLPLSQPWAIVFGTITGVADLIVVGVMSNLDNTMSVTQVTSMWFILSLLAIWNLPSLINILIFPAATSQCHYLPVFKSDWTLPQTLDGSDTSTHLPGHQEIPGSWHQIFTWERKAGEEPMLGTDALQHSYLHWVPLRFGWGGSLRSASWLPWVDRNVLSAHKRLCCMEFLILPIQTINYAGAVATNGMELMVSTYLQTKMKENLLKKILPKHLIEDVKKVLNRKLVEVDAIGPKRVFHELLVERHNDVRWAERHTPGVLWP